MHYPMPSFASSTRCATPTPAGTSRSRNPEIRTRSRRATTASSRPTRFASSGRNRIRIFVCPSSREWRGSTTGAHQTATTTGTSTGGSSPSGPFRTSSKSPSCQASGCSTAVEQTPAEQNSWCRGFKSRHVLGFFLLFSILSVAHP